MSLPRSTRSQQATRRTNLRDLRDQRDQRRLFDDTPMHVWAEVLDRPRFQKPTQIAQARYARSPIAQMDSVSQLRSHRASSGIFCSSFASSRLGGKVFASQYKRSGFADQEGSANLRRTKTLCSFCVLLRFLRVLRLRAVRASRSMAFLALLASQSVQRIDTQRAPRRHETGSNGHREQHDRHADERRGIGRRHTIEKLPQNAA